MDMVSIRQSIKRVKYVDPHDANTMLLDEPNKWVVIAFERKEKEDWKVIMGELPSQDKQES